MMLACSRAQSAPEHVSVGMQSAARAAPVAGAPSCHPSIRKERAVGCQCRLRGAWGENAEGMNGATHGAYMTWGVWWME